MYYNAPLTWLFRLLLVIGAIASYLWAMLLPETFGTVFATEDGPIEYATAVLLAIAAGFLFGLAFKCTGYKRTLTTFYGVILVWGAGEEISWGQRIFGWESSAFFEENNFQGETNLHNIVVGDTHLTEVIFGTGLAVVIMLYLVVLPLLYPRVSLIRRVTDALCVPLPAVHVGVIAILATLFAAWIDLDRQWEVYEFAFSVILCLIFLNPRNGHVYGMSDRQAEADKGATPTPEGA